MHLSVSDYFNFLIPSIILNPVLFLHSVNAVLTYLLPCLEDYDRSTYVQPHLDLHKDEHLCWVYTMLILLAQLIAFQRYDRSKEERDAGSTNLATDFQRDVGSG
jgi:hypothetical protein